MGREEEEMDGRRNWWDRRRLGRIHTAISYGRVVVFLLLRSGGGIQKRLWNQFGCGQLRFLFYEKILNAISALRRGRAISSPTFFAWKWM